MNYSIWSFRSIAIQQLLITRLQAALDLYIPDSLVLNQLKSHHFWRRVRENHRFLYVCAIALQLSQAQNIPAVEIARAIANLYHQISLRLDSVNEPIITVQVLPTGWLQVELTDVAIAAWLQRLCQVQPHVSRESHLPQNSQICFTTNLFAVQYAHARCCSLLQLAHRSELITLRQLESAPVSPRWFIDFPCPIPWLNPAEKLYLADSAERTLIALLIDLIDQLYSPLPPRRPVNWKKVALDLSHGFEQFYCHCRIWGEVQQTPQLAQARLGLVLVTQSWLRLILQELLNISAPLEL